MMKDVYCVLNSNPWQYPHEEKRIAKYTPENVKWLKKQVHKFHPELRFVCLSDVNVDGVETIPLKHGWPGWWSKIELYKYSNLFYLDLDVVITQPFKHLFKIPGVVSAPRFSSLRKSSKINSSVMSWEKAPIHLYNLFNENPKKWMKTFLGDQDFLGAFATEIQTFEDHFPGFIGSYRKMDNKETPAGIVCFNGKYKPHHVNHNWIPK
jgi:hypothetical protein